MKLDRLSPSQLTLYRANPCLWLGKYHWGWKDDAGPAAWRGSAVEAGLTYALRGDPASALPAALGRFEIDAQGVADDAVEKQRALIEPMLTQAIDATKDLPRDPTYQQRVETYLDGVSIPILCYVDYDWPDFLKDLKTTERIPSKPRADHVMQVAIYSAARKKPGGLIYVSDKRHQSYELTEDQVAEGLADARRAAQAIVSLCEWFDTPEQAARVMVPAWDDFRWTPTLKEKAMEIWA